VLLHVTIDIAVMEDIYTQKSLQEENEKNRLLGPLGCHDLDLPLSDRTHGLFD